MRGHGRLPPLPSLPRGPHRPPRRQLELGHEPVVGARVVLVADEQLQRAGHHGRRGAVAVVVQADLAQERKRRRREMSRVTFLSRASSGSASANNSSLLLLDWLSLERGRKSGSDILSALRKVEHLSFSDETVRSLITHKTGVAKEEEKEETERQLSLQHP